MAMTTIEVACLMKVVMSRLIVEMISMSAKFRGMVIIVARVVPVCVPSSIVVGGLVEILVTISPAIPAVTSSEIHVEFDSRFGSGRISHERQSCQSYANDQ